MPARNGDEGLQSAACFVRLAYVFVPSARSSAPTRLAGARRMSRSGRRSRTHPPEHKAIADRQFATAHNSCSKLTRREGREASE